MTYRYRLRRLRKVIGGERDGEGHGASEDAATFRSRWVSKALIWCSAPCPLA
jgi:hypothetical protein